MASDRYLTVEEAAQLARCALKTVRRAVSSGEIAAFRPAGRILMSEDAVRAWVEARPAVAGRSRRRPPQSSTRSEGTVTQLRELERHSLTK